MDVVNVEIANLDDLKKRFVEICATINRPGMEDLMAWLERSDFYTAPASTRFHGNYTGGLLEHSLNVYDKLSGDGSGHCVVPRSDEGELLHRQLSERQG